MMGGLSVSRLQQVQLDPVAQPDDPVPFLGADNAAGLPRIRIALR